MWAILNCDTQLVYATSKFWSALGTSYSRALVEFSGDIVRCDTDNTIIGVSNVERIIDYDGAQPGSILNMRKGKEKVFACNDLTCFEDEASARLAWELIEKLGKKRI